MGERRRTLGKKKEKEKEEDLTTAIPKPPPILDRRFSVKQPQFLGRKDGLIFPINFGYPIAEVFELNVVCGNKKRSKIHGTVSLKCGGFSPLNIFKRSRLNPQTVKRKGSLELSGPKISLEACDMIEMVIHLMEGRNDLARDTIYWDSDRDLHDLVYHYVYQGIKNFTWQLSYAVYKEAIVAVVSINFKPSVSVGVSGKILASCNMLPDWKTVLFSKKGDNIKDCFNMDLGEETGLPLLRYVLAVPITSTPIYRFENRSEWEKREFDGCLVIDLNLVNVHDGDIIAKGELEFKIENLGEYVGIVSSKFGDVRVTVRFEGLFDNWNKHNILAATS